MTRTAALIGLGTNLPWKGLAGAELLQLAVDDLAGRGLGVRRLSSIWRTPPWPPGSEQPDYHNAVAELEAGELAPEALYAELRAVERAFGRERRERWGPRTLDLDILDMEGAVGRFGDLILPHPRLAERVFVLAPLAEAAPDWRHPTLGRSAAELLATHPEPGLARRIGSFRPV